MQVAIGVILLLVGVFGLLWSIGESGYERRRTIVLYDLLENGPSYGRDLVKRHPKELKRGTVYVILGRMEEDGWITSRQEPVTSDYVGIPRRIYSYSRGIP